MLRRGKGQPLKRGIGLLGDEGGGICGWVQGKCND